MVVVRPVVIANEGHEHLRILRKFAQGPVSMLAENHLAPMWTEVTVEDIIFSVTPRIAYELGDCYGFHGQNSVGDIVDMILQAIEVTSLQPSNLL